MRILSFNKREAVKEIRELHRKKLENYIISMCSFQLPNSVDCALAKVGNLINLIKTQPQKKKEKKKGNKQLDDQNKFATELIAIRDE